MTSNMDSAVERQVKEGRASIALLPNVFYNPVQEFNRDLTIAVITQFSKDLSDLKRSKLASREAGKSELLNEEKIGSQVRISAESENCTETQANENGIERMTMEGLSQEQTGNYLTTQNSTSANNLNNSIKIENDSKYSHKFRILEALAATGLRSVRFALEIPGVTEIVANDYDQTAVEYIKRNSESNSVNNIITPSCSDAAMLMYSNRRRVNRFEAIDLDPYGSPTPFLDAAVQSVADDGLLCVTCTDMAVLCGNAVETCHAKYGSTALHSKLCHEMALRILLRCIDSHANRYSRYITPLLSISVDFYCRVFVRINTGQHRVKDSVAKLSTVYQCSGCSSFFLQPLVVKIKSGNNSLYHVATGPPVNPRCDLCGGRFNIGGPIWSDPIHDLSFVRRVMDSVKQPEVSLGTSPRIIGMLSVICEELIDVPLYYDTDDLCRIVHCVAVGFLPLRSAILNAGYRVSLSHASKNSLKTDAPPHVIWDIMRCWVQAHPVGSDRQKDGSISKSLLAAPPNLQADFTVHPQANPPSRLQGLVRWQLNPEADWGPKARATRALGDEGEKLKEKSRKRKREKNAEKKRNLKMFPCKRFQEGACPFDDKCKYSHDLKHTGALDIDTNSQDAGAMESKVSESAEGQELGAMDQEMENEVNDIQSRTVETI